MPTYEFRCPQGHEFEKFYRTISGAEAQAACPQCGQLAERIMSAAGFAFKGSGFYLTDYGKNAHREKSANAPTSGDGGSDAAKAEPAAAKGDAGSSAATPAPDTKGAKPAEGKPTAAKPAEAKPAPTKKSSDE
jgi:putative FmdB family regulatory protein